MLLAALAWGDDSALTQRLLGDAPSAVSGPASSETLGSLWPLGLAAAGACMVFAATKFVRRPGAPQAAMRVAGRVTLGGSSALLLVDVEDGAGGVRRLLVSGGGGPTSLLADLTANEEVGEEFQAEPVAIAAEPARARRERPDPNWAFQADEEPEPIRATQPGSRTALNSVKAALDFVRSGPAPEPIPAREAPRARRAAQMPRETEYDDTPQRGYAAETSPTAPRGQRIPFDRKVGGLSLIDEVIGRRRGAGGA